MNRQASVELLNRAIADELSAVHQYMYFHFHLDDQGFGPLAMLFKQTAIREMQHIEMLAERILFLKGDANLVAAGGVERITDAEAMLARACQMEESSAADYNAFALECTKNGDAISKQLFETLVGDEELHYDSFDKQMDNIKRFGANYLALQSMGQSEAAAEAPA